MRYSRLRQQYENIYTPFSLNAAYSHVLDCVDVAAARRTKPLRWPSCQPRCMSLYLDVLLLNCRRRWGLLCAITAELQMVLHMKMLHARVCVGALSSRPSGTLISTATCSLLMLLFCMTVLLKRGWHGGTASNFDQRHS